MQAVELFTGAGGLGIGISQAGFEPVAVVERDRYCCDTIRENQERRLVPLADWPLVQGDVRDFDYGGINGDMDLVSGGPPCQPFSLGGKHKGYLDKRDMFPEAIRAVRELMPRAFLFENVKGLTRPSFGNYFEYMRLQLAYPELESKPDEEWTEHLARLERHHTDGRGNIPTYRVITRVLNAADYGVPQRRERVFIVGFRSDLGIEWSFPSPTHSKEALLWEQWRSGDYWESKGVKKPNSEVSARAEKSAQRLRERPRAKPWRTVREALADLPDPELEREASKSFLNHNFQPGAKSYPGHTGSPHDEPAKTLKAGDHGVPGGENMLRRADGSLRYFSIRESARLQTFPDDYLFHGTWTESMRQLGNAVPVALAEVVAKSIRVQLESKANDNE